MYKRKAVADVRYSTVWNPVDPFSRCCGWHSTANVPAGALIMLYHQHIEPGRIQRITIADQGVDLPGLSGHVHGF